MKKNIEGFSIIIGIGLVLFISLSSYVILDTIIPFSKNTKGIEQSSSAYYQAVTGIETSLYFVKTRTALTSETGSVMPATNNGFSYQTTSVGTIIPLAGKGNSEVNKNYNQVSPVEQIQLEVGKGVVLNWTNIDFDFKVPAFTGGTLTLSGGANPVLNWILSSDEDSLIASGSTILANQVASSTATGSWKIHGKQGLTLRGIQQNFETFYTNNCGTNSGCVLKISVINDLVLTNGNKIPYLEYKINFGSYSVPQRYTTINASGKAAGFRKDLEVQVPQQTVNQAFDFTVFQ